MPEEYPYEKIHWYPHMMPEDVAVWERFINAYPEAYKTCQYDFPVGKVPDFVTKDASASSASMEKLYKKKIDVLARGDDVFDLIELKPTCTMSTIGQVKGYVHFFKRDYAPDRDPRPVVICGDCSDDVREYANAEGVSIIVV